MQKVKQTFLDAGLKVWTDEGIDVGTRSWKQAIQKAILDTKCLVCILSPDSAKSRWVQEELDFAELHDKKIYLILARGDEKSSIPFGFSTHQWVDIRHYFFDEVYKLITTINKSISYLSHENLESISYASSIVHPTDFVLQIPALSQSINFIPEPFDWCYIPSGTVILEQDGFIAEEGYKYFV
ncbi:MAG: toll/interleukin-1 receptor domain-containing protein, partial [Chloroflexota bacterium]